MKMNHYVADHHSPSSGSSLMAVRREAKVPATDIRWLPKPNSDNFPLLTYVEGYSHPNFVLKHRVRSTKQYAASTVCCNSGSKRIWSSK